jgi:hypothetical protein
MPSLDTWLWRLDFGLAEKRVVRDVVVAVAVKSDRDNEGVFARVNAALSLLAHYDPIRLAQLRRYARALFVIGRGGAYWGTWVESLKLCVIAEVLVDSDSTAPEDAASVIVHEITHARLHHFGLDHSKRTAEDRMRIEHICCRRQIAFARRLPNGDELIDRARAHIAEPAEYWSQRAASKRALDELHRLGCPQWIIRFLSALGRWRHG